MISEITLDIIKVRGLLVPPIQITRKSQINDLLYMYFRTNGYLQNSYRSDPEWAAPYSDKTTADKKINASVGKSTAATSGNIAYMQRQKLDANTESRRA